MLLTLEAFWDLAGPPSPEHALLVDSLAALRPDGSLYQISPRGVPLLELRQHRRCGLNRVKVHAERALGIRQADADISIQQPAIRCMVKVYCLLN